MPKLKEGDRSPWWLAFAGAIGVVAGASITGAFNYFAHQGDLDVQMIELSVGILRGGGGGEPTTETTPLREWAIDVIGKRGAFGFNPAQRAVLLKRELPFKDAAALGLAVARAVQSQPPPQ